MTIDELHVIFKNLDYYTWELYFFSINRKAKNPYKAKKIKMKNGQMLINYVANLMNVVEKTQLNEIDNIQEYDGENPYVSCVSLSITDQLLKEAWDNFLTAIANPLEDELRNKVKGYILVGQPKDEYTPALTMAKVANPVFSVYDKKSVVFKNTDGEMDTFSEDLFKLFLNIDFFTYGETLYAFNYKFEEIFNMEQTLQKLKDEKVEKILQLNCFPKSFTDYIEIYNHPKTFITLDEGRINRMKNVDERIKIAQNLGISMDSEHNFIDVTKKQALLIIQYLCLKILKDEESGLMYKVTQAEKLDLGEQKQID